MQKNTASQKFVVFAFNRTTNAPLTGDAANITANLQKDFGTSTATNDVNPTELEDGFYAFDALQAETNADALVLYPESTTSDIQVISTPGVIYTVSTGSPDEIVQTADNDTHLTTLIGRVIGTLAAGTHNPATAAQIAVLSDWIDGGRLDLLLDAIKVPTDKLVFTVANLLDTNPLNIDSDSTSATNLKNQYDGSTGLLGPLFPSNQEQVGNLTVGTGGISTVSTGFTNTGGGAEVNSYLDTFALDQVYHEVAPSASIIDGYYEFDVTFTGIAQGVTWAGYVQSNNDNVEVYGYDWIAAGWVQVGTILGTNSATEQTITFELSLSMTGTSTNSGLVRLRFDSRGGDVATALATDRILTTFTSIPAAGEIILSGVLSSATADTVVLPVGANANNDFYNNTTITTTSGTGAKQQRLGADYDGGTRTLTITPPWITTPDNTTGFQMLAGAFHAETQRDGYNGAVWIDSNSSSTGTLLEVNGTEDNPVNNIADATIIEGNVSAGGLKRFRQLKGSSITLTQTYNRYTFNGTGGTIALGGQDLGLCTFQSQNISGVATGSGRIFWRDCRFDTAAFNNSALVDCSINGTISLSEASNYQMTNCYNSDDSVPTIIDFTAAGNVVLSMHGWSGCLEVRNMTAGDEIHVHGQGDVNFAASCTGGVGDVVGQFKRTNNGTITITYDDVMTSVDSVLDDTGELQSNQGDWATATGFNTVVPDPAGTAPTAVEIRQEIDSNSTQLSGIKTTTDKFVFTVDNQVDSNMLTHTSAIPSNFITAAGIATSALDNKGNWNIGKTGYTLTQNFPTNFADLSISATTGLIDITQTAADKSWSTTTRILTASTNFNDLSAAQVNAECDTAISDAALATSAEITALTDVVDDLAIKKNTALSNFEFLMVLTSDHATPGTGLTVTGQRSIDGGAFTAVTGTIAEVSNGIYQFDALAADTNGDLITWRFSEGTADDTFVTFKTVQ